MGRGSGLPLITQECNLSSGAPVGERNNGKVTTSAALHVCALRGVVNKNTVITMNRLCRLRKDQNKTQKTRLKGSKVGVPKGS